MYFLFSILEHIGRVFFIFVTRRFDSFKGFMDHINPTSHTPVNRLK